MAIHTENDPAPRRRRGRKPTGHRYVVMSILVPPEDAERLEVLAFAEHISRSEYIRRLLRRALLRKGK